MMTLQKDNICNCKINLPDKNAQENEVNKEELCRKICENILQSLLEGYEDLMQKHPEKTGEFQSKINEIKKQMQGNQINNKVEKILSL